MISTSDLAQTAGFNLRADNREGGWLDSRWWEQLQPASWRGVDFVMDAAENRAGRRTAVHEYPYRDTVWVEDLGRLPRRFAFQGFIVGDDVYQQRNAMIQACEQPGEGTLVHPTLGSVQCVLIEFSTTDRRERGRMVEIAFSFVVSGDIVFPQTSAATGEQVGTLAGALSRASAGDLSAQLGTMRIVPQQARAGVPAFGALATGVVDDPARALNATNGLQGYYGRYATGRRSTMLPASATPGSALAGSISSRQDVLAAVTRLTGVL
ncbi:MAG TPA: DNA circularization N-terminal domain-containing protein [Xanthobacteraceae bacterium]|nr:DNA circularization N-terminal domain-containing protein [Xanthobacteraceae bacterium]